MEYSSLLKDKVAFITGSTRGIGWACARLFARHGATVLINGSGDKEFLEKKVEELSQNGSVLCRGYWGDVSQYASMKEVYTKINSEFKKLDILVNNAGYMSPALLAMTTETSLTRMIDVNFKGAVFNMQLASRLMMKAGGGSIINVSSIMGQEGAANNIVYSGTKGAVISMTRAAAKELAPHHIRVNAIAPGYVVTDMTSGLPDEIKKKTIDSTLLKRSGVPEDMANAVLFLASDMSSFITGKVLGVDGGMSL